MPFPASVLVANILKTKVRPLLPLHGMEVVVGSIPTRPTIFCNAFEKGAPLQKARDPDWERPLPAAQLNLTRSILGAVSA